MPLDERLFGWASDLWRARRTRADAVRLARGALAAPLLPRLRNLASALAGFEVDAAVVDAPPAISGRWVLFPRLTHALETPADNERLLLLFATFAGWRIGQEASAQCVQSQDSANNESMLHLADLVELPALESTLALELPGWAPARNALADALVEGRPDPATLGARQAALEHLARARLGRPCEPDARAAVAAVVGCALVADRVDPALAAAFLGLGGRVRFTMPPCWGGRLGGAASSALVLAKGADVLPHAVTHEREGRLRAPARRRRALNEQKQPDNPFTHSFEKVHTVEEYKGGQKRADGSDELADHAAGLDEIDLEETALSSESVQSVYRAGAPSGDLAAAEVPAGSGLRYDEWDGNRRRYLPGYCRVRIGPGHSDEVAGRALVQRVKATERRAIEHARAGVLRLQSALRWRTRQLDGPEVDVDAAIERVTALRARHEGSQHVYLARRRSGRELAVLVLLDASLSTDAWVDNRRVLDVERDAAVILAVALEGLIEEFGLAAFSSDTHEDCRFIELKGFDESIALGAARLAALQPAGYTRMGPAIRHATTQLAACRARRRLLVVLTDGKPSDRDRYEGRHGESDVRQAMREAGHHAVDVLALGADPRAASALRAMFGSTSVCGLARAADVAEAVAGALARRLAR